MIFSETELPGAFIVRPEELEDERGFFALSWAEQEFLDRGLESRVVECDISFNRKRGTLRGLHYQEAPHGQAKLVRCTMGSIFDVLVDLRPESPTFKRWFGLELSARNRLMLYVPIEFAHGFQTLEDNSEVFYQMSSVFVPASGRCVSWNDPAFGIQWPSPVTVISEKDKQCRWL